MFSLAFKAKRQAGFSGARSTLYARLIYSPEVFSKYSLTALKLGKAR